MPRSLKLLSVSALVAVLLAACGGSDHKAPETVAEVPATTQSPSTTVTRTNTSRGGQAADNHAASKHAADHTSNHPANHEASSHADRASGSAAPTKTTTTTSTQTTGDPARTATGPTRTQSHDSSAPAAAPTRHRTQPVSYKPPKLAPKTTSKRTATTTTRTIADPGTTTTGGTQTPTTTTSGAPPAGVTGPTPIECLTEHGLADAHEWEADEWIATLPASGDDVYVEGPFTSPAAANQNAASYQGVLYAVGGGMYTVESALTAHLNPVVDTVATCLSATSGHGTLPPG